MILYLAAGISGNHYVINKIFWINKINMSLLKRVNLLESFYYIQEWHLPLIHKSKSFMLDSGAFSFMLNPKIKIDWDEYLQKYANFINEYDVELFFELDIDTVVGQKETTKLRHKLIDLTGKKPIWVLQHGRSFKDFKNALKEYPYIALSLSGKTALSKKRRRLKTEINILCDIAHNEGVKIHGLGFTHANLQEYNFDSVDSTAWLSGNKFGFLYKFTNGQIIKIQRPSNSQLKNKGREVALHNFKEWIKYSEYLEIII